MIFWRVSPCPETHVEKSVSDELMNAVRTRPEGVTVEEIHARLLTRGYAAGDVHNAIIAISILEKI